MKLKSAAIFAAALGVFLTGATYRFHDSAHAIGRLSVQGGSVNHPVLLDDGNVLYTVIVTGVVAPPYRGDARVAIEGDLPMTYRIHISEPVIDLGLFRRPQFRENTLYDLREKDKVALWVVLKPKGETARVAGEGESALLDPADVDCCDVQPAPSQNDERRAAKEPQKRLSVAFRDIRTGKPILTIPIVFRGRGEPSHGAK